MVNNGNLGAIARSEQWHLNLDCLQRGQNCPLNQGFLNRFLVTTVSRQALDINYLPLFEQLSRDQFIPSWNTLEN